MSRPIVLWIVNQYAVPARAAGITRHATLARILERDDQFRVRIFAGEGHYWSSTTPTSRDPHFTIVNVRPTARNGLARVFNMIYFSARVTLAMVRYRTKPDVIMGSTPHLFGALAGYGASRLLRVPFVLEVRDLWPRSLVELLGLSPKHPVVLAMSVVERFLYRRSRVVFSLLEGSERHISQVAGRSVDVRYVPNGVDPMAVSEFQPAVGDKSRLNVMYAGAHGVPNALDVLLDAWSIVERNPRTGHLWLTLVGDGKEKANLMDRTRTLGLVRVSFLDPVPKPDVPRLLAGSSLLVISWRAVDMYKDGISANKLYDYMAAGRPVVMALDAATDPLRRSGGGLTVAPEDPAALADGITAIAELPGEERDRMGRRGREYVLENHSILETASVLADGLREVTANEPH